MEFISKRITYECRTTPGYSSVRILFVILFTMRRLLSIAKKASTAVMMMLVMSLFASSVHADGPIFTESLVYDSFDSFTFRPDPGSYWYLLNYGDAQIWDDQYCGDATCFTLMNENNTSFARMSLYPDSTPGFYNNVELAERNTGFASQEPGKWYPESNHPVVVEARVRWSEHYNNDGTGAVGSNGVWLWNSPIFYPDPNDLSNGVYGPTEAFGFSWSMENNAFIQGLAAGVVRGEAVPALVYTQPLPDVYMQDWVVLKMVWSKHQNNTQRIQFFVNGEEVGTHDVITPDLTPLTVEIWQDNQQFTLSSGTFFHSPEEEQYFDLDYVKVEKL